MQTPGLFPLPPIILALLLLPTACATAPPGDVTDACAIFGDYPDWRRDAGQASRRWGVPVEVLLAVIRQESGFRADARPPRTRILWIIPGPRPSTAYGYTQALDTTWEQYLREAGAWGADRDAFEDAVDFVGWYVYTNWRRNGVARHDTYRNYLAYHEGHGGYARGSYRDKPWLLAAARRVARQAARYRAQLDGCREATAGRGWWPFG